MDALKAQLDDAVESMTESEEWIAYLRFTATLTTRYSVGNTILLWTQAVKRGMELTAVASYGSWKRKGRHVVKGAKGFAVLAPVSYRLSEAQAAERARQNLQAYDAHGRPIYTVRGFKLETVFDLSQTDGEPLPANPVTVTLLEGADPTGAQNALDSLIHDHGYTTEHGHCGGANGYTDPANKIVRVRDDISDLQAVKTTVHELAHIRAGHVDDLPTYQTCRGRCEAEAEAIAFIVCGALGADTTAYSVPYITTWTDGDNTVMRAIAETVTTVAHGVLADIDPDDKPDQP